MAARMARIARQLTAEMTRESTAVASSAEWKSKDEVAAAAEKILREENSVYSKQLLGVVRMASGAIGNGQPI